MSAESTDAFRLSKIKDLDKLQGRPMCPETHHKAKIKNSKKNLQY